MSFNSVASKFLSQMRTLIVSVPVKVTSMATQSTVLSPVSPASTSPTAAAAVLSPLSSSSHQLTVVPSMQKQLPPNKVTSHLKSNIFINDTALLITSVTHHNQHRYYHEGRSLDIASVSTSDTSMTLCNEGRNSKLTNIQSKQIRNNLIIVTNYTSTNAKTTYQRTKMSNSLVKCPFASPSHSTESSFTSSSSPSPSSSSPSSSSSSSSTPSSPSSSSLVNDTSYPVSPATGGRHLLNVNRETREFSEIPTPLLLPTPAETTMSCSEGAAYLHKYCDYRHKSLGPVYREIMGDHEIVFVSDADLMKQIYSAEGQYPVHYVPEAWTEFNEMKGIKRGLFFMDGPEWSERRRSLNRIFLKKETISEYADHFNSVVSDLLTRWSSECAKSDQPLGELERELYNWSIESLGTMIFGRRLGCVVNEGTSKAETIHEFVQCIRQLFVESSKMIVLPARVAASLQSPVWKRFCAAAERALTLARGYVQQNVQDMSGKSTGHGMTSSSNIARCPFAGGKLNDNDNYDDDDTSTRNSATDSPSLSSGGVLELLTSREQIQGEEVVNIITDLFLAAADTTSHATQWALYLLAKHPECQDKLLNEVKRVLNGETTIQERHLTDMSYVKGVIKESLRLYPVAPFLSRVLDKDITLNGYRVPAGKMLVMSLYTAGRDSKYFKDAETFDPERWVRDPDTRLHQVSHPHACIPFGLGVRSCIGRRVAEMQMQFLLSRTIQSFSLSTDEPDIDIKLRMITTPERQIKLKFKLRQ